VFAYLLSTNVTFTEEVVLDASWYIYLITTIVIGIRVIIRGAKKLLSNED